MLPRAESRANVLCVFCLLLQILSSPPCCGSCGLKCVRNSTEVPCLLASGWAQPVERTSRSAPRSTILAASSTSPPSKVTVPARRPSPYSPLSPGSVHGPIVCCFRPRGGYGCSIPVGFLHGAHILVEVPEPHFPPDPQIEHAIRFQPGLRLM